MTAPYVKKLAEEGKHGSLEELEAQWKKAGDIANKQAEENPNIVSSYAYITSIFQGLLGIEGEESSPILMSKNLTAAQRVEARNNYFEKLIREGKHGTRKEIEKKWEEAKAVANQVGIRAYPYMIAVFQNLLGIRKTAQASTIKIEAAARLLASDPKQEICQKISDELEKSGTEVSEVTHGQDKYLEYESLDPLPFETAMRALGFKSVGISTEMNFVKHHVGYDIYVTGKKTRHGFAIHVSIRHD